MREIERREMRKEVKQEVKEEVKKEVKEEVKKEVEAEVTQKFIEKAEKQVLDMAVKFKKLNVAISDIAKATGLPIEVIEKL